MKRMPRLTDNAMKVLKARYLLKDPHGRVIESPQEMFRRVARAVSAAESSHGESPGEWEERYFGMMSALRFMPNSPALMNAGKENGQLAACFVLPVDDSMES
ncbi:MAG: hypothetical protein KAR83_05080, partial [Thermodesulfovibrionales bacterium]|nr:hypothetical protein [Thermodesulfovibrionales bacterium]